MAVESLNVNSNHVYAVDIQVLPEDCIANALSLTSPRDACRLSLVASTFRLAAQSDAVWERFLPNDYKEIISRSDNGKDLLSSFPSKKDLYLHLCDNPIIVDGGTKSFSLEKWTGKKCYMLAARDLMIVWGDTPRYWRWVSESMSRFPEVAELLDVCWLEVRGKINISMLSPNTTYAAYLVFTSKDGIHGFEYEPAEGSVGISGQESKTRTVFLDTEDATRYRFQIVPRRAGFFTNRLANILRQQSSSSMDDNSDNGDTSGDYGDNSGDNGQNHGDNAEYPKPRDDGWTEVMLGEFYVKEGQEGDLEMSLMEVKGGNWKSGLMVQGIEIRPTVN